MVHLKEMSRILVAIIIFYKKFISPLKPASCRFYPSCSEYSLEAIQKYGCLKGAFLSIKRILKCHPYHPGGYDPVPDQSVKLFKVEKDIVNKTVIQSKNN